MSDNPILYFILNHFVSLLYGVYLLVFLLLTAWESFAPRRALTQPRLRRWFTNFTIFSIDTLILQALSTLAVANLAYLAWKHGWGLLNHLNLSPWAQLLVSLPLLDLLGYANHLLYHKVPLGWRLHRVHHMDLDLDSTSGLVFHPLEALASFAIRQLFVVLVGPAPLAVVLFDSVLTVGLLVTHANIRIHPLLDRVLRWMWITPDMHRIHHSVDWGESNSNFGVMLSWWDRLFGTYRPKPKAAPEKMPLGLSEFRAAREVGLGRLLLSPFRREKS